MMQEYSTINRETTNRETINRLRIAYLTQGNPHDKRAWSCSLYYVGQALQKHCGDVTCLGPLPLPTPGLLARLKAKSSLLLFHRRYLHETSLRAARSLGAACSGAIDCASRGSGLSLPMGQAQLIAPPHRLDAIKAGISSPDVIIAVASEAAIAYLETETPVVLVGDTTYAQAVGYIPYYARLSARSLHEIDAIERRVFAKVRASVFSSEWAARFVIEHYHVDPRHVYVVPFGVNLDHIPEAAIAAARAPSAQCRLLFMGVDWQRKGGEIAYETLLALRALDIDAELIVCGCTPPTRLAHPHMTVIPFLDKNDPRQQQQLEQLFITAHFLLLPTRADCAPNVFREAAAFGLPVITTNTGGVSSIICDSENGSMLPLSARGGDYAALIARIYRNEEQYTRLVGASRAAFEQRLNWDAWGQSVHAILLKELGYDERDQSTPSTINREATKELGSDEPSSSKDCFSDIRNGTG
jgi:glycosyltransferase involved in cell wall biosynthesis